MPGFLVHMNAAITCMHMAPATVTPTDPRVLVSGQPVATVADIVKVSPGCPFQIPFGVGTKPQPCVRIQLVPSTRVLIGKKPALTNTPGAGVCLSIEQIPQGLPVVATQVRAGGL